MSLYCEAPAGCIELCKPACFGCAHQASGAYSDFMTNVGRSEVALRACAGLFVVMVGCGAAVVGAGASAPAPDKTATNAMSSEAPAPPGNLGGPSGSGGALPVVPVGGGGCIPGLNCGCIRGITCPGTYPHHHPTVTNGQPNGAPAAPHPGGGGG